MSRLSHYFAFQFRRFMHGLTQIRDTPHAIAGGVAIGVLSALWQTGRRVPADVAVVSCDDIQFAEYLTPPLTTVRVPLLPVELIVRGSCGAPAPAEPRDPRVPRGQARVHPNPTKEEHQ